MKYSVLVTAPKSEKEKLVFLKDMIEESLLRIETENVYNARSTISVVWFALVAELNYNL